jgi:hypothetical protein
VLLDAVVAIIMAAPPESRSPIRLCRRLDQSSQCGLYRDAGIGVSKVGSAQQQPGGNTLEKDAALLHRQAAGGGHDQGTSWASFRASTRGASRALQSTRGPFLVKPARARARSLAMLFWYRQGQEAAHPKAHQQGAVRSADFFCPGSARHHPGQMTIVTILDFIGPGEGNRTLVISLEGKSFRNKSAKIRRNEIAKRPEFSHLVSPVLAGFCRFDTGGPLAGR